MANEKSLTLEEVAKILNVSEGHLRARIGENPQLIPGTFKFGTVWRFTRKGLNEFIANGGTLDY
jgi:hypothetical protein